MIIIFLPTETIIFFIPNHFVISYDEQEINHRLYTLHDIIKPIKVVTLQPKKQDYDWILWYHFEEASSALYFIPIDRVSSLKSLKQGYHDILADVTMVTTILVKVTYILC